MSGSGTIFFFIYIVSRICNQIDLEIDLNMLED